MMHRRRFIGAAVAFPCFAAHAQEGATSIDLSRFPVGPLPLDLTI